MRSLIFVLLAFGLTHAHAAAPRSFLFWNRHDGRYALIDVTTSSGEAPGPDAWLQELTFNVYVGRGQTLYRTEVHHARPDHDGRGIEMDLGLGARLTLRNLFDGPVMFMASHATLALYTQEARVLDEGSRREVVQRRIFNEADRWPRVRIDPAERELWFVRAESEREVSFADTRAVCARTLGDIETDP